MKKGVRIPQPGDQLPGIVVAYEKHRAIAGVCSRARYDADFGFAPGAYIGARPMTVADVEQGVLGLIRNRTAFVALHAPDLVALNSEGAKPYWSMRAKSPPAATGKKTIGGYFEIFYGQKSLHNKEALLQGASLVVSSSGVDNGCYGFFDFDALIEPPFVTVPSTGSIAEAHVQERPCGVTDDCLVLVPKQGVPHELLYVAAAVVRGEKWRFSYGRKATPERIADFPLSVGDPLIARVRNYLDRAAKVERAILRNAEDALDGQAVRQTLAAGGLVRGAELEAKLVELER